MATDSTALLSAQQLTCIREDRLLFDDLSFSISAGDILQIEGANGSGKTSLLRILAGLTQPYSGDIHYNGIAINKCSEEFHSDLLFLGHLPGVKGEMTSSENLDFYFKLHGLNIDDCEKTLSEVDLYGFEDAMAGHLSAGQHRRIALARLFESTAKIWILDEPFTAIDKAGVKKLEQLFLSHVKNGGAIILTTHQDLSLDSTDFEKIVLEHQFV